MKRLLSILMILVLLVPCALSEAPSPVYASDFSIGTDGWYARSMGSAKISVTDGVLTITGRTDSWNSPGRDFPLVCGGKYEMSVMVYQDEIPSATLMISVAHTKDGAESYENLGRAVVPSGEWAEISAAYTAGDYEKFVLYVETVGASDISFSMKDFVLTAPFGEPEPTPKPEPMKIEEVENMPSLKEIYSGRFDFGSAIPRSLIANEKAAALIKDQFAIVTHENELKPESVLDIPACRKLAETDETAVAINIDAARPLLDFAKENGLKVHGHTLVWHSQTPETFFLKGYQVGRGRVDRETMLARMENYISAVMAAVEADYPGLIVSWDVVNEAIDDSTGKLRKSPWLETVGEDYLARAFEYARKYAPEGVILCYNDYNTAFSPKLDGIVELLEGLISEGNIDGYGFQMHIDLATPSMAQLENAVDRIAKLGLKLRVSELDVKVGDNSEESFVKQAKRYAEVMKLLDKYADQFEAVHVWGLNDGVSWLASQYPLLFDANNNPKPAFWAVADPASVK